MSHKHEPTEVRTRSLNRRLLYGLIGALILLGGFALYEQIVSATRETPRHLAKPSIVPERKEKLVLGCDTRQFQDWSNQCTRIIGYADVLLPPNETATKLVISYDGDRIELFGMVPKAYHYRFYTNALPTLAVLRGEHYVADRSFFNEHISPTITVGKVRATLAWSANPHWAAPRAATAQLINAFRKGSKASITFAHWGEGGGQRAEISLFGFSAALRNFEPHPRFESTESPSSISVSDAVRLVGGMLVPNQLGVEFSDLKGVVNPKGSGVFVYVARTRFGGVERKFIWFVSGKTVMKLNGATHKLAPAVPFARNAPASVWAGTGLTPGSVRPAGLALAFGD